MTRDQERQALWGAVLAHPDDDDPRLVFADWLEERGTATDVARAPFIRVQCELARLPVDQKAIFSQVRRASVDEWVAFAPGGGPPRPGERVAVTPPGGERREGLLVLGAVPGAEAGLTGYHVRVRRDETARRKAWLVRREAELLSTYGAGWVLADLGLPAGSPAHRHDRRFDAGRAAVGPLFVACEFGRGLVDQLGAAWETWRERGGAVLARLPLRRVELTDWPDPGDLLAEWYARGHTADPPDLWGSGASAARAATALLAALWPGVRFGLPTEPADTDCVYVVDAPGGRRGFRSLEEARRFVAEGGGQLRAVLFPGG